MFIETVANLRVTNIVSANRLSSSPVGYAATRKSRDKWAILLKISGKTIYTVGNNKVVSDNLHPVILPKGCSYSWKCVEAGPYICIEFDADTSFDHFTSIEISDNSAIINAFSKIERRLGSSKPHSQHECHMYLYEILAFLLKSANKEYSSPQKKDILRPAIKYISEKYYDSTISNDFLANLCDISTVYFRKTFETVYGNSPIKYLHNFRIEKAKDILLSDYESIEQVALSVGYGSIYNFSKMFRLYTGVSPSQFAKAGRK